MLVDASSPAARSLSVGDVVDGKYRVERLLGRGGMGAVYAATHLDLEQEVALKVLLPELARDGIAVERFLREARAAVQLRSEHVARVLDVGRTGDGVPYMVIEYLEGSDLGVVLEHRGALSVSEATDFVLQACEAIAEAHALGIVHRDIKPQNLFVTRGIGGAPLVKVLDFGISKSMRGTLSALTRVDGMIGSPAYMAPEQLRSSRDVDARSDVWSLGVVLQELVTGRMPFEGEAIPELTLKIAGDAPRPARLDRPDLPDDFVAILGRCLQKDPSARFASVADLEDALRPLSPPPSSISSRVSSVLHRGTLRSAITVDTASVSEVAAGDREPASAPSPSGRPRRRVPPLALAALALAAIVGSVFVLRARSVLPLPPVAYDAPASLAAALTVEVTPPAPAAEAPSGELATHASPSAVTPTLRSPPPPRRPRAPSPRPANDEIPSMR